MSDHVKQEPFQSSSSDLKAARLLLKHHRAQGFAALNALFRRGSLPEPPPGGRYAGELIALDIAPLLTAFFQGLASLWMPWRGKVLEASHQRGENIFTRDSYLLARLFNPLYRGFRSDRPGTYRAFAFHTYTAPGLMDADRQVLKIDYDLKENPALTVRRVLDELVELDASLYLGKAHVHWWWGRWQTVAFFSLASPGRNEAAVPQTPSV
jgi:hypothetical protein